MSGHVASSQPTQKPSMSRGKYYGKLGVGLFIMFVLGLFVPTWGGIDRVGVQTICIFVGTIFLITSRFGLIMPSMLAMLAIVFTGFHTPASIISSTFGSTALYQLLLVYVLCHVITTSGAGDVMVRWLLSRKILKGRPVLFFVVFLEAASLFACLVGTTGAILFFITLTNSLCDALGYDDDSHFKKVVLCASFISASMGSPTLPFKGSGLMVFGLIATGLEQGGIIVDFGGYIVAGLVNQLVFALILGLAMKPIFRCDTDRLKEVDMVTLLGEGEFRMNTRQKIAFWGFIIACSYSVLMLMPIQSMPGYAALKSIGQPFVFAIMICILCIVHIDGKPMINPGKAFKEGIKWDIIYAYAAFATLGGMLADDKLDIKLWLSSILEPVFGQMSFPVFVLVLILLTYTVTNFFSNMATGLLMGALASPYMVVFSSTLGVNPSCLAAGIAGASCVAYLTMGAGNMSAVFLGQPSMERDPAWVWKWGLLMGLLYVVVTAAVLGILSYVL